MVKQGHLYLDYVDGRMVKLSINAFKEKDIWFIRNDAFSVDYQSFADTYPTPLDLIKSVEDIEILGIEKFNN